MKVSRRQFLKAGSGALLLTAGGCDQASNLLQIGPPSHDLTGPLDPPESETLDDVSHALNRLGYGPRPGDYARVKTMGVAAFLDEQLAPEKIDDPHGDYIARQFETLNEPAGELFEYQQKFLLDQMTRATLLRAIYSRRQLHEVMVRFWSDHFNIDPSKGDCKWLKAADDREVVRAHALGRFADLLRASALSPAMLWYLDGRVNRRRNPADKPNENYARELLELHTLGVHGGYTQQDVMEVARCLTGWTVRGTKDSHFFIGTIEFKRGLHDQGEKLVLGRRIPAGGGEKDLDSVLEIVALHPSTAHHIATKLCRHFISDEPADFAVRAVGESFLQTGGDIRETLRTLLHTEDFRAARGVKFKRPFEFVVSALRATNAATDGGRPLVDYLQRMGHAPFRYPTPDGYPEAASHWMGTLLWRWNFATSLCENRIKGTRIDPRDLFKKADGTEGLTALMLGRKPRFEERSAFENAGGNGIALALASPAFQRC